MFYLAVFHCPADKVLTATLSKPLKMAMMDIRKVLMAGIRTKPRMRTKTKTGTKTKDTPAQPFSKMLPSSITTFQQSKAAGSFQNGPWCVPFAMVSNTPDTGPIWATTGTSGSTVMMEIGTLMRGKPSRPRSAKLGSPTSAPSAGTLKAMVWARSWREKTSPGAAV